MRWAGVWRTRCSLVGKCPRSINKSARRAQHNKTPNVPAARPPTDCTKYGGVVHSNHLAHAHTHIHLPARAASSLTLTDSSSASPSRLTPASISASPSSLLPYHSAHTLCCYATLRYAAHCQPEPLRRASSARRKHLHLAVLASSPPGPPSSTSTRAAPRRQHWSKEPAWAPSGTQRVVLKVYKRAPKHGRRTPWAEVVCWQSWFLRTIPLTTRMRE